MTDSEVARKLEELREIFPQRMRVTLEEACAVTCLSPKTYRNRRRLGAPIPFPAVQEFGKSLVELEHLAAYLARSAPRDDAPPAEVDPPPAPKRGRGRPRREEALAAAAAGMTVPQFRSMGG